MLFAKEMKDLLMRIIHEMTQNKELFVKNPGKDFSRTRKQSFEKMMQFILSMEGDTVKRELMKFFNFSSDMPSDAAFNQQRSKILPKAFEHLFRAFTDKIPDEKFYRGYRLMACDGTSLYISRNPSDKASYCRENSKEKGYNLLHLNTMYDLLNRKYIDAVIQPAHQHDEREALYTMVERLSGQAMQKNILIADRGYTSFNVYEHIEKNKMNYLIRIKDFKKNRVLYGIEMPDTDEFDITVTVFLTNSRSKGVLRKDREKYVKYISKEIRFDFLKGTVEYPVKFRIVRFAINKNTYECLATNLAEADFSIDELKRLYRMRWGIESSYRELKYATGLRYFHAKKRESIEQEIWARLTLYNFSEAVILRISVEKQQQQGRRKYQYQINYTIAQYLCRLYLKLYPPINAIQLEAAVEYYVLPVRWGRSTPRNPRPHKPVSFCYRNA